MSKLDDIRTMLKNAYGLSDEDVTSVVRMVSEIVADQMPTPAPAAPSADMATKEFVAAYVDGAVNQLRIALADMIAQGMERMAGALGDAAREEGVARS